MTQTTVTVAVVLAALAALITGFLFWQADVFNSVDPRITRIEFPSTIASDGQSVKGVVRFNAPSGTLVKAQFDVVKASFFMPFGFDPEVKDTPKGTFEFYISGVLAQTVTLRLTLTDEAGHTSKPKTFRFKIVDSQDPSGNF